MLLGPFRGSDAIARGWVTEGVLRGRRYRRLFPDVYLAADVELTLAMRSYGAYLLVERASGVLAGYSAAELLGRPCGPVGAPAEVLVPGRVRPCPRLVVRRGVPEPGELRRVEAKVVTAMLHGRRRETGVGHLVATTPLRAAWDLVRRLDLVEAVVVVDALARKLDRHRPGFDPADLLRLRAERPGARGCRVLDEVLALADPRAESPMETRLRLLLVRSGLPVPQVQYPLADAYGDPFVRFDLAYPEARFAIEYDGAAHDDALDRARDVLTSARGWHTMRLLHGDVVRTPARTVAAVREVRAQRTRLLGTERYQTVPRS